MMPGLLCYHVQRLAGYSAYKAQLVFGNNRGLANEVDLLMLLEQWLISDMCVAKDINRNGSVRFSDYVELLKNWPLEDDY